MKERWIVIFLFLGVLKIGYGNQLLSRDTLFRVTSSEVDTFANSILERRATHIEFYFENNDTNTIEGFIYYSGDTLYIRLFYTIRDSGSALTFRPISVFDLSSKKEIEGVLRSIARYKKNLCYEQHVRKNPYSQKYPNMDPDHYWKYWLRQYKNGKELKVWRDKLTLEDDDCNSKSNKIKERRDFDRLKKAINSILLDRNFPILAD